MRVFKRKKLLIILTIIILSISIIGCSKGNKAEEAFNNYKEKWISKDFKGMYELLSSDSKAYIKEEKFLERYNNIYSAIESENILIENKGDGEKVEKDTKFTFTVTMDTLAGNLKFDNYKLIIVKEGKEFKVQWNEALIFPDMIPNDKVMVRYNKAKRGKVLDRLDKELAKDGKLGVIGIHPIIFNKENKEKKINEMAEILDISKETIEGKLNSSTNPEHFVPIVDTLQDDERLRKLSNRGNDGILIQSKESRVYAGGEAFGGLVGFIGPITAEELEKNKDKGYTETSLIGKSGIESVYEEKLKGENGSEIYIERAGEEIFLAEKEVKNGENIKLSIDSNLQVKIYNEMDGEKGASTAVDPKTGEILAMVTSPSYDSNIFTTYTTKTQKKLWEENHYADQENRFNHAYSPGSVMKLITATIGLENGVASLEDARDIKGKSWQKDASWGGYNVTRVKDPGKSVDLRDAVKYSDNIYFAQVALDLGTEKFMDGVKRFGIGEKLKFEYPMETSQLSNDGKLEKEVLLADTSYGQGEVMMSPLDVSMIYSALGNSGNIMMPRLVVSDKSEASVWKEGAIKSENLETLINVFTAPISDADGTAHQGKINGIDLAGKTGTAEIKASQEDEEGTEDAWFVALDTKDSKVSISMIIEDVKGRSGTSMVVSKVKNILQYYLKLE